MRAWFAWLVSEARDAVAFAARHNENLGEGNTYRENIAFDKLRKVKKYYTVARVNIRTRNIETIAVSRSKTLGEFILKLEYKF